MNDYINIKIQTIEEFFMIQRQTLVSVILLFMLLATAFSISGKSIEKPLANDELDIDQSYSNSVDRFYENIIIGQSFRPSLPELTRVELFVSKRGDITSDFRLYIKETRTSETILTQTSVSSNMIPTVDRAWIMFDFADIEVDTEKTYYIFCTTDSGTEESYYEWYQSNLNRYNDGLKYVSDDNGETWLQEVNTDCSFRTYGAGPILHVEYVTADSWNTIEVSIKNEGTSTAENIKVTSSFSKGLSFMIKDWFEYQSNTSLAPDHELHVSVSPVIGFGATTMNIDIWSQNAQRVEHSRPVFLFLFYIYISPE